MALLVDTNVIIDVVTADPQWAEWSLQRLEALASEGLSVNPVIFAELCYDCATVGEAESIVRQMGFAYLETPRDGLFRAARAFADYRRAGGSRNSVLPDFFIGGHAEASGLRILTRDVARYRTYFPKVELIAP